MTPAEQLKMLAEYAELVTELTEAKAYESKIRRTIAEMFGTPGQEEGTEKLSLAEGAELKIVHVLNYTVNNKQGQLDHLRSIMPADAFNALFRVKYELSMTAYKELTQAQRETVNFAINVSNGIPTLEYKPPTKVI